MKINGYSVYTGVIKNINKRFCILNRSSRREETDEVHDLEDICHLPTHTGPALWITAHGLFQISVYNVITFSLHIGINTPVILHMLRP